MPDYRRAFAPGGTLFFTLVTERRAPILAAPRAPMPPGGAGRDARPLAARFEELTGTAIE